MDIAIRRGSLVTDRGEIAADVGIEGEKIAAIGRVGPAARELDARGKLVLPGVVDLHTHLGGRSLDDVTAGTRGAAAGGVTTVLTFAHQQDGEGLRAAVERTMAETSGATVDYAFHVVVNDPSEKAILELPDLVRAGHTSLKVFMVRAAFAGRVPEHLRLFRAAGRARMLTLIHAEDHGIVAFRTKELLEAGRTSLASFPECRPVEAEEVAVRAVLGYAQLTEAPMYLVHLSSKRAVDALREGRVRKLPVYGETRPLYLHLTRKVFERPDGALFVGQPPIREQADQDALWKALNEGILDTIGTDHYPHRRSDKMDPSHTFDRIPPGVANLQTLLPMVYSEGVRKSRLTLRRMVEVLSTEPARLAGLASKGRVEVGADADLVVFDPDLKRTVRSADLRSNADHDPFEGWEVHGWPIATLVRGKVVYARGEEIDAAGHGKWLARKPFVA